MKKYVIFTVLLILCTGCSKKEVLRCTKSRSDNGFSMEENLKLDVNNEKATSIEVDIDFSLEGNYLEHRDVVKSNIDEMIDAYKNQEGIQVSTLENENSITINLSADYDNIKAEIGNDIFGIGKYKSDSINIESVKKQLESEEYNCTISDED